MSFLQSFNFFPQTRYLRVRRTAEVNHQCGGLASLIILLALLVILFMKLDEAINKKTVFVSSQSMEYLEPPLSNISTFMNSTTEVPYMMAIELWERDCTTAVFNVNASLVTYHDNKLPTWYRTQELIALEACTAQHFKLVPQLWEQESMLGISSWYCLPLNQKYELGGDFYLSSLYRAIQITISCSNSCPIDTCGQALIHQLSTKINPSSQQPFEHFFELSTLNVAQNTQFQYAFALTENILKTDNSLLPIQSLEISKSFDIEPIDNRGFVHRNIQGYTTINIERSGTTRIFNRNYLKLIDILSYVGGIFPSLLGIFFFMNAFGMYFFEMTFAYKHFKCKETKYSHFGQYLKLKIYRIATAMGCAPRNWFIAKHQNEINHLVNKMLDINYLYKRIEFLQTAISVLLQEHQLKGIYLSQITLKKADNYYHRHKIRDRMVTFLNKKLEKLYDNQDKPQKCDKNEPEKEVKLGKKHKKSKFRVDIENIRVDSYDSAMKFNNKANKKGIKKQQEADKNISKNQSTRIRNKYLLARDLAMLDEPLDEKQLEQFHIQMELEHDLKTLFKQARKKKGDPVSKRIVENIDQWLRSELEIAIDEFQQQNPRFHITLRDESQQSLQRQHK